VRASQSSRLKVVLLLYLLSDMARGEMGEYTPGSVEVCVVEGEEVFVLVVEALDGVRLAFGKVPDVAES
jgi:hypothetical protein